MINITDTINAHYPNLKKKVSKPVFTTFINTLNKLLHINEINKFIDKYGDLENFEFIEKVFEYLEVDYITASSEKQNIPTTGRVVIVSNHPLGALDSLALLKLVGEVRRDVKIVANDMLMQFSQIKSLLLPVNNMTQRTTASNIKLIIESLENEEAIIIFPAGEVSRARPNGVKDIAWSSGFLKFASKTNSPILPVFINAKNSFTFYSVSSIYKPASMLLLPNEMFKKRKSEIKLKVGEIIPSDVLNGTNISKKVKVRLLKRHLEKIGKNKKGIFATQKSIAHPESRQELKNELKNGKILGETKDKKIIYLCNYKKDSALIREIGRLREYSFRKVGEGSGSRRDIDKYDKYYKHLVLWDEDDLEIVGAYRIGESENVFEFDGFYTQTLAEFYTPFKKYLKDSIELGRSFVQPKYWGSRALDYLWQGIGAYLRANPQIRYMFGPVSMSDIYSYEAKSLIAHLYLTHFGSEQVLLKSNNQFDISKTDKNILNIVKGESYEDDFKSVKEYLSYQNLSIPTLYKQYSDVCEKGGVKFLDFGIDKDFGNCVDGFILVDIAKLKESKRKRYIG
jgi:putative hemolysin